MTKNKRAEKPSESVNVFKSIILSFVLIGFGSFLMYNISKASEEKEIVDLKSAFIRCESEVWRLKKIIHIKETEEKINKRREVDAIKSYIVTHYKKVGKEVAQMIAEDIIAVSNEYNIPSDILVGLIETESSFNPTATSAKGARGLSQVMPSIWAKELGFKPDDLYGISDGLKYGAIILKHYVDKSKGDITKALRLYNGSKGNTFPNRVFSRTGRFVTFKHYHGVDYEKTAAIPESIQVD